MRPLAETWRITTMERKRVKQRVKRDARSRRENLGSISVE
jgi:hypothetical protein